MAPNAMHPTDVTVIKLGGSVLIDTDAFRRCADALHRRLPTGTTERLLVVVSAELGTTDRLRVLAEELCPAPDRGALDLLWSTGELRSVALLTLGLRRVGVDAIGLNVHECGLVALDATPRADRVRLNLLRLRYFLSRYSVVVVPGFLARGPFDSIVALGRGASDLTAVLLARELRATCCELIKDVPGYFTADPRHDHSARPIPWLSYDEALAMARAGCDLVQVAAIEAARRTNTTLLVRSLSATDTQTTVSNEHVEEAHAADGLTALAAG